LPDGGGRLAPIEKKQIGRELAIPPGATGDAQDGDLVAVETAPPRRGLGLPTARVIERLGSIKSERAVSLIAINAHGIPHVFPPPVLKEAEAAQPASTHGREDWRKVPFVTIDPADAKDHDDAVYAEPDPDPKNAGGHVVRVAIADVAAFVHTGTALDREAHPRQLGHFGSRGAHAAGRISNDLLAAPERRSGRAGGADRHRRRWRKRPHVSHADRRLQN
jgi:ribonuclease R